MRILFIFTLIVFVYLNKSSGRRFRRVTPSDQEELENAQRNAECCAKKMRCCRHTQPPPIEMRAVYAHCPSIGPTAKSSHVPRVMDKPLMPSNEGKLKSFQGFDEDEPLVESHVTDCRTKIIMTMKLHHSGAIVCKSQYVVVDHVYDPVTDRSVRLLNPYVIRLRQEPVSRSFRLKFIDYVNSEAHEAVYNKQDANFTGCYATPQRSTCGRVRFNGKAIPFSEGFCCSCDSNKNKEREGSDLRQSKEEAISYSDPSYLLDHIGCPPMLLDEEVNNTQPSSSTRHTSLTHRPTPATKLHSTAQATTPNVPPTPASLDKRSGSTVQPSSTSSKTRWQYTTYSQHATATTPASTKLPLYLKRNPGSEEELNKEKYLKQMSDAAMRMHNQRKYMETVKKSHKTPSYLNPNEDAVREAFQARLTRKMRQTFPSGVQKRGGQNCADRYTPPGLDPDHYHDSAHCLRFSDVWYGIYKLGEPSVEQLVYINIYERYETASRSDRWVEVTNGTIRLGNRYTYYQDELPSIAMTFTSKLLTDPSASMVGWEDKRILIPEGVSTCDAHKYPEMSGGPEEFLVVPASRIALEGEACDRIGVGFEAFYLQPQRCGQPRGTCLHNQPKHLWRNDKHLEQTNRVGCYFLKYHANITTQPLFINETTGEKFLFVEYEGAHVTIIDIELKADQNAIVRDIASAIISEVYVDSTCGKYTRLTIKLINTGLVSSKFLVQLSDFPLDLPEYFSLIRSKLATVAPQTVHIFTLEVRAALPTDLMYCSVEVLNKRNELVALRRVRIQKFDRCICAWYCLCACVSSPTGLRCNPMSLEHYHAAGFEGALPIVTYLVHFTMLDDLLSVAFYFVLFLLGVLLVLGLFKAVLGLCWLYVGMWGLAVVLDLPQPMQRYYEHSLRHEPVIYDDDGWPIHPRTYHRTRNISLATGFCSNLVFFYTYPLTCAMLILRRLCCPYETQQPCPGKDDSSKPVTKKPTPTHKQSKSPKPERKCKCTKCRKQHKQSSTHVAKAKHESTTTTAHSSTSHKSKTKQENVITTAFAYAAKPNVSFSKATAALAVSTSYESTARTRADKKKVDVPPVTTASCSSSSFSSTSSPPSEEEGSLRAPRPRRPKKGKKLNAPQRSLDSRTASSSSPLSASSCEVHSDPDSNSPTGSSLESPDFESVAVQTKITSQSSETAARMDNIHTIQASTAKFRPKSS